MVHIVNLTPHEINFFNPREFAGTGREASPVSGPYPVVRIPSSGFARCTETRTRTDDKIRLDLRFRVDIPINVVGFGDVESLPDPQDDTIYIVSRSTAERVPGRNDLLYPDEIVRSTDGSIAGCLALARAN